MLREAAINTHRQQETGNMSASFPTCGATYGIFLIGRLSTGRMRIEGGGENGAMEK